jgi:putative ABC transport system substrate-binding protein
MQPRAVVLSAALVLGLLAAPFVADAQQPGKVYRIGWLGSISGGGETDAQRCPIQGLDTWQAGLEGLRERGYIRGQNLLIECRWTEGRNERTPALAKELVDLQPDLIVAIGGNPRSWKRATSTIPIVMVGAVGPVEQGVVGSLAHPGGNLTGLTFSPGLEVFGEQPGLLKEAVPTASRVALLSYQEPPSYLEKLEVAAHALGLTLLPFNIWAPEDLASAFARMATARADALLGGDFSLFVGYRQQIVDLAFQHRLPTLFPYRDLTAAGALMSYGPNLPAIHRRIGSYVDKILHGANPADLPIEEPKKFDLVINLKTAKALGLSIPQPLLKRADEVIE